MMAITKLPSSKKKAKEQAEKDPPRDTALDRKVEATSETGRKETPRKSDDWVVLSLPRAHTWYKGMTVKDSSKIGNVVLNVLENEVSTVVYEGKPVFRAVIGAEGCDTEDPVKPRAFLHGGASSCGREDCYWIYTHKQCYEGQEPSIHLEQGSTEFHPEGSIATESTEYYLYGKASRTELQLCTDKNQFAPTLEAKVIRPCVLWPWSSKRNAEFYSAALSDPNKQDEEAKQLLRIVRDQQKETLAVKIDPSTSDKCFHLLTATALAYAFDRMVKPFGSKQDQIELFLENSSTRNLTDVAGSLAEATHCARRPSRRRRHQQRRKLRDTSNNNNSNDRGLDKQ